MSPGEVGWIKLVGHVGPSMRRANGSGAHFASSLSDGLSSRSVRRRRRRSSAGRRSGLKVRPDANDTFATVSASKAATIAYSSTSLLNHGATRRHDRGTDRRKGPNTLVASACQRIGFGNPERRASHTTRGYVTVNGSALQPNVPAVPDAASHRSHRTATTSGRSAIESSRWVCGPAKTRLGHGDR